MCATDELRRHPEHKYQTAFDAEQLGDYFFSVYLKMFADEDWSAMSPNTLSSAARRMMLPLSGDLRYYTRLGLVFLLRLVKKSLSPTGPGACPFS